MVVDKDVCDRWFVTKRSGRRRRRRRSGRSGRDAESKARTPHKDVGNWACT